jgi:hypothetical protein
VTIDRADIGDTTGLRVLFARLDVLSTFEDDWDSYGALPPTARAVGLASRVIVECAAHAGGTPSAVMPLPDGGLQLLWERGSEELQIDVGPDGALGYLAIHRGGGEPGMAEANDVSLSDVLALVENLPR